MNFFTFIPPYYYLIVVVVGIIWLAVKISRKTPRRVVEPGQSYFSIKSIAYSAVIFLSFIGNLVAMYVGISLVAGSGAFGGWDFGTPVFGLLLMAGSIPVSRYLMAKKDRVSWYILILFANLIVSLLVGALLGVTFY